MGPQRGSAVLERRETEAPIRVDTRTPGDARARPAPLAVTLLGLTVVVPGTAQLAAGNRAARPVRPAGLARGSWPPSRSSRCSPWSAAPPPSPCSPTAGRCRRCRSCCSASPPCGPCCSSTRGGSASPTGCRGATAGGCSCALLALLLVLPGGAAYAGMNVGAARAAMTSVFASGEAAGAVDGRYNILLLGGDSGAGRVGLRPDSIQLASVDAETGRAVLFGFSRETENIRFRPGLGHGRPDAARAGPAATSACSTGSTRGAPTTRRSSRAGTKDPGLLATTEAVEALDRARHPVLRARRPQGLPQPRRRGRRPRHRRAAPHADRLPARDQGLDRGRQPAPRRLPRPLVRPQPRQLHELRADGAPALRRHRDGPPARPADRSC